jgi:group II intron reverse transcriptase/maturase
MSQTHNYLDLVRRRGEQGLELNKVYRMIRQRELYLHAYANLYANKGALTPGIDPEDTVDGMSLERIARILDKLANGTYEWTPVRRVYIEKSHSHTLRPLGLPGWNDKMVQEVMKMVLEAYYEPQFRDCSHGFRPQRGCHTALREIYYRWHGTKWFIELDIKGCFDNIHHGILMDILGRRIKDARFLKLLWKLLQAGYMEDWSYHTTYSGTPQGGILSPLLANIVLNELDIFIEDELIPEYTRGKKRKINPDYQHWVNMARQAKKKGDKERYKDAFKQQRACPTYLDHDPNFARLRYVRYADDSLLGWMGTKAEADTIKQRVGHFLLDRLVLEMSEEKTLITHARDEKARFLNYHISTSWTDTKQKSVKGIKQRTVNGTIRLEIPPDVIKTWKDRIRKRKTTTHGVKHQFLTTHRAELMNNSDYDIIIAYETHIQGLINYYSLAHDVVRKMGTLRFLYERSLAKTLAAKFKTSIDKIYKKYTGFTADGRKVVMVQIERPDKPPLTAAYGKKKICQNRKAIIKDVKPTTKTNRTELLERLLNNECELCGKVGYVEGHHIRKLKDLQKKQQRKGRKLKRWEQVMIALRRKTLFVCRECHHDIRYGRYDGKKLT